MMVTTSMLSNRKFYLQTDIFFRYSDSEVQINVWVDSFQPHTQRGFYKHQRTNKIVYNNEDK